MHAARGWQGGLALVLVCLTVYLPGFFTIPPVDRDESRFAQASRQMFESVALPTEQRRADFHDGGLVIPKVRDRPRLNKPPLIYWLQAGSAGVLTWGDPLADTIWMYRLPSLLAGVGVVLLTWLIGRSMFDPRAAWLGAVSLAVAPVFVWEAHQARADMVLVLWTTAAMGALWKIWGGEKRRRDGQGERDRGTEALRDEGSETSPERKQGGMDGKAGVGGEGEWFWAIVLWIAVGLGVLTKGPITPMVVVLSALLLSLYSRRWRWLRRTRPILGLAIVLAMVGPWVVAVGQRVGWERYASIVFDEVIGRSGSAREGHWGPPGYHLVLLAVLFWPGSLLTGLSFARAIKRGLPRRSVIAPDTSRERKRAGRSDLGADRHRGTKAQRREGIGPTARFRSRLVTFIRQGLVSLARGIVDRRAGSDAEFFCLAWIVPAWIVFELVGTKLPHYTMPMYPPLALLSARGVFAAAGGMLPACSRVISRLGFGVWTVIGMAIGTLALFMTFALGPLLDLMFEQGGGSSITLRLALVFIPMAMAIPIVVGWVDRLVRHRRLIPLQFASVAVVGLALATVLGLALPRHLKLVWTSDRIVRRLRLVDPNLRRPLASVGYHEDSFIFATRGGVEWLDANGLVSWLGAHPNGLVIVPFTIFAEQERLRYPGAVGRNASDYSRWSISGLNYSNGEFVDLVLAESKP